MPSEPQQHHHYIIGLAFIPENFHKMENRIIKFTTNAIGCSPLEEKTSQSKWVTELQFQISSLNFLFTPILREQPKKNISRFSFSVFCLLSFISCWGLGGPQSVGEQNCNFIWFKFHRQSEMNSFVAIVTCEILSLLCHSCATVRMQIVWFV